MLRKVQRIKKENSWKMSKKSKIQNLKVVDPLKLQFFNSQKNSNEKVNKYAASGQNQNH